jgi:hypothetical protein
LGRGPRQVNEGEHLACQLSHNVRSQKSETPDNLRLRNIRFELRGIVSIGIWRVALTPAVVSTAIRRVVFTYLIDNQSCVIVGVQATTARLSQESAAAREMKETE